MAQRELLVRIVGDNRSLQRAFVGSSRDASRFNASLVGTTRGLRRSALALGALGAGLAGAGVAAGKAGASFEQTMQKIVGLSGVAQGAVDKLTKEVLLLAPAVGKAPQELAAALFFITSSGIKAADAMAVLEASAKASAAGLGETQVVADAVTSAMNAYGPATVSAQRATDVLVATVREGKGEADQFAGVIGNVAALAAQLGVSFEDVGAALAAQTRLGTDAETASTQLQQVFSNLVKVTPKAAKAFKSVGLSAAGLRKQLAEKGLLSALQTIQGAFGDNLPALADAFGDIRALRGVLALVGKQAESTAGIFDRMADSTGSLKTAFEAVSETTVQRFNKMRAAIQVGAIKIGAALAPLAGVVASAVTTAVTSLTGFAEKVSAATSFSQKLDVVFTGVKDVTGRAQSALGAAVAAVDWDAVWAKAEGIADGLQKRLEEIDWAVVGRAIGDGIADAVKTAIPATKELASRLTAAIGAIDFVKIGKAAGPGLATAMVTAFATLVDPAFWAKNWDLAVAVAAVSLPGRIVKLAAVVGKTFGKLGADAVQALLLGLEVNSPKLAAVLLKVLTKLPAVVGKALSLLFAPVKAVFSRLGKLAQFTVKVLGLTAAINAVADLGKRIGSTIKDALGSVLQFIKTWAIKAALLILEPFTHLPFGLGSAAQDAKERLQGQLKEMVSSTQKAARDMNLAFASVKPPPGLLGPVGSPGPQVPVGPKGPLKRGSEALKAASDAAAQEHVEAKKIAAVQGKATAVAAAAAKARAAAQAKGQAAALAHATKARAAAIAAAAKATAATAAAAAKAREIAERAREAFAGFLDSLQLGLERSQVTAGLDDDLAALRKIEAALRARLKVEKNTVDLQRQLFQAEQQVAALRRQQRDTRQFGALGLSATGTEKIPGLTGLRKQLGNLGDTVKGTFLDTSKTQSLMNQIRKILAGGLGAVSDEVRAKVKEMLDGINQQLKDHRGRLTKTTGLNTKALVAGLGLSPEQIRAIRGRASGFNSAGTAIAGPRAASVGGFVGGRPIVVESHTTLQLDGHTLGKVVTRGQQKTRKRNPPQRRGPNAGMALG